MSLKFTDIRDDNVDTYTRVDLGFVYDECYFANNYNFPKYL